MRITPLDIRNHTFPKRWRGLDAAEVASFLHGVSEDFETLVRENEGRGERIRQLEQRVEQLVDDERLLKETLLSAQAMTTDLREAAVKETEVLVGEAEVMAEKILDAAHRRAARIAEEIGEMRGVRARVAEGLRATLETHLSLVDSLEAGSHAQADEATVTYLARTTAGREASREAREVFGDAKARGGANEPGERTTG
jgi:cell division initiation protein